jgi:hypothetical protein
MRSVEPYLELLLSDVKKRNNFALAGLFLTYRSSNHSSVQMTTEANNLAFPSDTLHYRRLVHLPEAACITLSSTEQYRQLVGYRLSTMIFLPPSRFMLNLVLRAK